MVQKRRICNDLQQRNQLSRQKRERELAAIEQMLQGEERCLQPAEKKCSIWRIGALPIMGGTWDRFTLTDRIDLLLPKDGPHVLVGNGDLCKALALQCVGSGFLSLSNTEEFFTHVQTEKIINEGVQPSHLNRYALSRVLDDIYSFGTSKFFRVLASHILSQLGKKTITVHLDSTSVHFHGSPQEAGEGTIGITFGYSRDGHPELPQVNVVGLADHQSGLPVFFKGVSGNENDKKSFLELLCNNAESLKASYPDVKYVVGDSALCTAEIFDAAGKAGLYVITKMPLTNTVSRQYIAEADSTKFTDVYQDSSSGKERGQWCPETVVGSVQVKALLIENSALREKHLKKMQKDAEKEKAVLEKDLRKLSSAEYACVEDARVAVEKRLRKCVLCRVENVTYEEIWKNSRRGRPRAGEEADKKLAGIRITAEVAVDEEAVAKKTEMSIRSLIVTSDVERQWTMEELLTMYRGQSCIESTWRMLKDKRLMAESIYLEKPERIEALMCLLYLFVLLLKVTEILLREAMEKKSLVLPPVSREAPAARPTISRMIDYTRNQHLTLLEYGDTKYININNILFDIFASMGAPWLRYYLPGTYADE